MEFKKWLEGTKATVYTRTKGATVDDSQQDEPTVTLNIDDIINYEQASKMDQPKSQENMQSILSAIGSGQPLPPILVRKVDNLKGVSNPRWNNSGMVSPSGVSNSQFKYQVIDGHHRYWAYKKAGIRQIPAIIVSPQNIRYEKFWNG